VREEKHKRGARNVRDRSVSKEVPSEGYWKKGRSFGEGGLCWGGGERGVPLRDPRFLGSLRNCLEKDFG